VLARKPLVGTVAENVAAHRAGALHIDACRAGPPRGPQSYTVRRWRPGAERNRAGGPWKPAGPGAPVFSATLPPGRWPANIVFSHGPGCGTSSCVPGCPVAALDLQSGTRRSGAGPACRGGDGARAVYGRFAGQAECRPGRAAESGGAARFFPVFRYQAKATAAERPVLPGITHPTVKPLDLMRWLVRLTTPPGGTVLDPFAGSGTTLHACLLEGARGIGIEKDPDYVRLCAARLQAAQHAHQPPAPG
jgi:site-specific DNA-methyltransferase (adenine-specific)